MSTSTKLAKLVGGWVGNNRLWLSASEPVRESETSHQWRLWHKVNSSPLNIVGLMKAKRKTACQCLGMRHKR